jgi:hypothetical protein
MTAHAGLATGGGADRRRRVMRILLVAGMIGALMLPALAQNLGSQQGGPRLNSRSPTETPEQVAKKKAEEKANDKAFNEAVKRIPGPEKKYDPWGNVRNGGN